MNCANNADDIVYGTELAKLKNVKILPIKFGKSLADYSVDKPSHAIYKGIESIKYCNAQIADELMSLAQSKEYEDFIDLLNDINAKTSVNSRQLEILTGLNYFSDFGNNKKLLEVEKLYDKFAGIKQIKKDKMEELGVNEFLMKKYAEKETAKIYKGINWLGLLKELCDKIPNESLDLIRQMKFEKDHLEYVNTVMPDISKDYYVIVEFIQNKV